MKRLLVILGAGASWDVAGDGVVGQRPRPPLARDLFNASYSRMRKNYVGADVLGQELEALAVRNDSECDLEQQLVRYATSPNEVVRQHFNFIPPYLRTVIVGASKHFLPSPPNYIRLVTKLMEPESNEVMFLTLNYDRLLEAAIERYHSAWRFDSFPAYVDPARPVSVVKAHGSTNWFLRLHGTAAQPWPTVIEQFDPSSRVNEDAVLSNDENTDTRDMRCDGAGTDYLYPWLTAPIASGKRFSCPTNHVQALREFMSDCRKILVVGTSGLDEDLLQELRDTCPRDDYRVWIVGKASCDETYANFRTVIKNFAPGTPRSPYPRMYDSGFDEFLASPTALHDILAAD